MVGALAFCQFWQALKKANMDALYVEQCEDDSYCTKLSCKILKISDKNQTKYQVIKKKGLKGWTDILSNTDARTHSKIPL